MSGGFHFFIFVSQYLLRLVCDVTFCVIFIMKSWLLLHYFRAKNPIKLNAPDDLLSKRRSIFDPVSIMLSPKDFFLDFHCRFFVEW